MACEAFEQPILDYVDNQLPPAEHARVATHLAGCAACRTFARQLEQLDTQLARTLKPPTLSPAFNARLRQRIQSMRVLGEAERLERKRQLQVEYETGLARLNLFHVPSRRLLPTFRLATVIASVVGLVWQFLPQFVNLLGRLFQTGLNQNLAIAFTVSAIFVALGFAAAGFPRHLRRILAAAAGRGY